MSHGPNIGKTQLVRKGLSQCAKNHYQHRVVLIEICTHVTDEFPIQFKVVKSLFIVEKLVHTHTNLVLRESLDDTLRNLLPWDIELVIDEPVDEQEEEPEV